MSSEPTESMSNSFDHASRHESGEPVSDKSSSNGEAKYTVEPIAIVGMSLKFPEASSEDEFWDILMQKRCVSKEFPRDRLNIDRYHSSDPGSTNKVTWELVNDKYPVQGWRYYRCQIEGGIS